MCRCIINSLVRLLVHIVATRIIVARDDGSTIVTPCFATSNSHRLSPNDLHTKKNLSKHFFSTNTILITSDQQHCCCDSSHGFTFSLFFLDNHRLKSSSSSFSTSIFSFVYFPSDTSSSAASVSDPRRQSHCLLSEDSEERFDTSCRC